MNHRLNAYKDNNIWITYCEKCSKEADELLGSNCAGQVEAVIFKCKYPNCDGGSATGYCRTECWQEPTANKNRLGTVRRGLITLILNLTNCFQLRLDTIEYHV